MEDYYGLLLEEKGVFLDIVDSAQRLIAMPSVSANIKDNSIILLEFIKEFYMNYPLKGQDLTVTDSNFDELDFSTLENSSVKQYYRNIDKLHSMQGKTEVEQIKDYDTLCYEMLKEESAEVANYFELSKEVKARFKDQKLLPLNKAQLTELESHKLWSERSIHLTFGNQAIISIVESPYLTSRIIIRDITGKHAWLMSEHRVIGNDCINTTDYNDKAAVYKNALEVKDDINFKEIVTAKKTVNNLLAKEAEEFKVKVAEALKPIPLNNPEKMADEVIAAKKKDILANVLELIGKAFPDMTMVPAL